MEKRIDFNKKKSICFVDNHGNQLFEIPDGECIELVYGDGAYYIGICRYVDELHFKFEGTLWNLHDFAKRMKQRGITIQKCM